MAQGAPRGLKAGGDPGWADSALPKGYSTLPSLHSCPLTACGLAPGWQLQAAHPYSAVTRMWSQDKQHQSHRKRQETLPMPSAAVQKQTAQDNLFSQVNFPCCSPAHLCLRHCKSPPSHPIHPAFACLFSPAAFHLWPLIITIPISEISTGGAQIKGICCPDTRIIKRMGKV